MKTSLQNDISYKVGYNKGQEDLLVKFLGFVTKSTVDKNSLMSFIGECLDESATRLENTCKELEEELFRSKSNKI